MNVTDYVTLIFLLFAGHALADFAFQSAWMSMNKGPRQTPSDGEEVNWPMILLPHAAIHGLMVFFVTFNIWLALMETVAHFTLDYAKKTRGMSFAADQWGHYACKAAYVLLIAIGLFTLHTGWWRV